MIDRFWYILLAIALFAAPPATAQDVGGAWKVEQGRVGLRIAKVAFPDRAGVVALTKTGEFSNKGEALDNYAQYESPDGKVFATAYVYRSTYADAALAAYATSRAILSRFGATTRLAEQSTVAFAGQSGGALRQVFTGARHSGADLTSTAAFARVGSWIVKLRASGPADRGAEIVAALDALIAGAGSDLDAKIYPVAPLKLDPPCPAGDRPAPKLVGSKEARSANMLSGLFGGSAIEPDAKADANPLLAFPSNGLTPACVRGSLVIGGRAIDLLQPSGTDEPPVVLAATDDAGTVLTAEKSLLGEGYTIKRYAVGRIEVAGTIDRQPTAAQLSKWLATANAPELTIRSTTSVKASGDSTITIDTGTLK